MKLKYASTRKFAPVGRAKKINFSDRFLALLRPYNLILITTLVSFAAWLFPDFGYLRKGLIGGYYNASPSGVLVALAWVLLTFGVTYLSYTVGLHLFKPWAQARRRVPLNAFTPYLALSVLGWIGVAYVAAFILSHFGVSGVVERLKSHDANALKDALYDNYSVGLPSLRYITILSGALAIYHLAHQRYRRLSLINLLALAMVAIISSRLSIIATIVTALPLLASSVQIRLRRSRILLGGVALFLLLSALNWSRNGNFYRNFGIDNWLAAGFSEILTYVGSAFQGFLAAATRRDDLVGMTNLTLPPYILVSPELSTNSALLQLITEGGVLWAFSFGALVCMLGGLGAAFAFKNRRSFFFLLYGPLVYSFAELWRIYLFGQGIIKTLIIIAVGVPLVLTLAPRVRVRLPRVKLGLPSLRLRVRLHKGGRSPWA